MNAAEPEVLPARASQLRPLDVRETRSIMDDYQRGLREVVAPGDWQQFKDRGGETREFLKRSGWRKIATWFALDLEIVRDEIGRDDNGRVTRAHVVARAIAPNGRHADGDGGASADERRFSKPEHDIPAVATTRATNRAIANLVGMGELSAEEMSADATVTAPTSLITGATAKQLAQALQRQVPDVDGFEFLRVLRQSFVERGIDGVPEAAAQALEGWIFWIGRQVTSADEPPQTAAGEPLEGSATETEITTEKE